MTVELSKVAEAKIRVLAATLVAAPHEREQLEATLHEVVSEVVESLDLPDFSEMLDLSDERQIEQFIENNSLVSQNDLPNTDDFLDLNDSESIRSFIRDNELVDKDELGSMLDLENQDQVGEMIENYELVTEEDLDAALNAVKSSHVTDGRGFFGRLKWLLTGR
jgi:hypothetical protein